MSSRGQLARMARRIGMLPRAPDFPRSLPFSPIKGSAVRHAFLPRGAVCASGRQEDLARLACSSILGRSVTPRRTGYLTVALVEMLRRSAAVYHGEIRVRAGSKALCLDRQFVGLP